MFEPLGAEGLQPARVAVAYGATFRVYLEHDETLADITGRMRHEAQSRRDLPAVGDWVGVRWPSRQERATIQRILPRTSIFSRKVAGQETAEQILAANVNVAFLVAGLDRDFNIRRLERYLAMTRESGATSRHRAQQGGSRTPTWRSAARRWRRLPAPCRSTPSVRRLEAGSRSCLTI